MADIHNKKSKLNPDEKGEERQEIDPIFKQLVEEEFDSYKVKCQTEYEVSRLPRTIDAFITIDDADELQKIRQETPFFYFLKDNQLEFKGRADRLTKKGYHVIRGRMEYLLHSKNISPLDTTSTIICAGKPRAVLEYAAEILRKPFVATKQKGYYKSDEIPPIYLIVVNELPIIPENYPLLVFASNEKKFREFLDQVIAEGQAAYISYAYKVRPKETKEVLTMAGIPSSMTRKDLEFMADDIGQDMIAVMNPETILKGMNEQKQHGFLSLFSIEQLLQFISMKELVQAIGIDGLLQFITIEELLENIEIETLLQSISIEKLVEAIGIDGLLQFITIEELLKHIDTQELLQYINIGDILNCISAEQRQILVQSVLNMLLESDLTNTTESHHNDLSNGRAHNNETDG